MPQSLRYLLILIALVSLPAFAGENRWTLNGPSGGNVSKFAFDPSNASIVYAASDNGVFRSTDGGQHWTGAAVTLGTSMFDIAVASADRQKVFASSVFGLYKSSDGGGTWAVVHGFSSFKVAVSPNGNTVYSYAGGSGVIRSTDGGVTFGSSGAGLPAATSITALVIDPQNTDTVYASFLSSAGVYKSIDGGAHWTAANSGLTASAYYSLAIDPSNSATLYVGPGPGRIFKSTDGGTSWAELTNGLSTTFYRATAVRATTPTTILAATDGGIYKSTDAGASWTGPTLPFSATMIAINPVDPTIVLAVSSFNVLRSANSGLNYTISSAGLNAFYTQSIAVDPRNEAVVYASGPAGIVKSTDRGVNWTSIGTFSVAVAVDPFNSQTLYSITSGEIRRSIDGGATWQSFTTGLPSGSAGFILPDSNVQGTIYTILGDSVYKRSGTNPWVKSSTGLPTGFPAFLAIDRNTLYAGGTFGIYKSIDGAASWTAASNGLSNVSPGGIAIDPFDSQHLFTWANSSAYQSTNGGANWTPFAVAPNRQSILLAFDPSAPGVVYNSSFDAIDRSVDGGKTWSPMQAGLGRTHGNVFVISPSGKTIYTGGASGGVWVMHFARGRAVAH
jgi:photosystem II stability/assembly factor-like uncharacterized protein